MGGNFRIVVFGYWKLKNNENLTENQKPGLVYCNTKRKIINTETFTYNHFINNRQIKQKK